MATNKMFSSFRKGKEDNFEDTSPIYVSGRFHAIPHPNQPRTVDPFIAGDLRAAGRNTGGVLQGFARLRGPGVFQTPNRPRENTRRDEFNQEVSEGGWGWLLDPGPERVERWLNSWWKRWAILVGLPCFIVWAWCAFPFPVSDPYAEEPPWNLPWPGDGNQTTISTGISRQILSPTLTLLQWTHHTTIHVLDYVRFNATHPKKPDWDDPNLPVDANFYFFLVFYYGLYLAAALIFVTKLFDIYRLSWWPTTLGGGISYMLFWTGSLVVGLILHRYDLDGFKSHERHKNHDPTEDWEWERKTAWVVLAFATMAMPALACFIKLRSDRRQTYRRSLTVAQKTFLERQLTQRMPKSYKRFLWFMVVITLSLVALILGQGFATIYLSTLPHSNLEGLIYVWTWIASVQCLAMITGWILNEKVRNRSLVFIFRFYYFLVYQVFYRNLFARLRSPDQALYIQLLSSSWVVIWYPISMSRTFHKFIQIFVGYDKDWESHAEEICTMLYLRNLAENVTMVAFLGWVTILHYGPNTQIYPFFAFDTKTDPYTYKLTAIASLTIWATELASSFVARCVVWWTYRFDVTNIGLDEFRGHPELVVSCVWTSVHVLSDMLLFLIKLNFR